VRMSVSLKLVNKYLYAKNAVKMVVNRYLYIYLGGYHPDNPLLRFDKGLMSLFSIIFTIDLWKSGLSKVK